MLSTTKTWMHSNGEFGRDGFSAWLPSVSDFAAALRALGALRIAWAD